MKKSDKISAVKNLLFSLKYNKLDFSSLEKDLNEKGAEWIVDNKKPQYYDKREPKDALWIGMAD